MNHLKSGSEGFALLWWMRYEHTWRRCWKWVLSTLVKAHNVTQSCWCTRKMEVCAFTLTSGSSMPETRKTYALLQIQEAIESLVGVRYFSCLDLKAGVWQIAMDKASKQYTPFTVGKLGFFKCKWMPFGLCNAPVTFQRLMQNCLGELNLTYCLIYLDDVIVFSETEEEHIQHLHLVFECSGEHSLKLKPTKYEFARMRLIIWLIMSPRRGWGPVKRTWRLWQSLNHPKLTWKSEPV